MSQGFVRSLAGAAMIFCLTLSVLAQTAPSSSTTQTVTPELSILIGERQVKFTPLTTYQELRLEVFNNAGELLYASGAVAEAALNYNLHDSNGQTLAPGLYAYALYLKTPEAEAPRKHQGHFIIERGNDQIWLTSKDSASVGAEVTGGALTVARNSERTTAGAGYLASGRTLGERARLQRAAQGRTVADRKAGVMREEGGFPLNISGSGTTNRLTKWLDGPNGVVGDSVITETASGDLGIGTTTPGGVLDVVRNSPNPLIGRFWNNGTGPAQLRFVGGTGATSQFLITDTAEWLTSIAVSNSIGMQLRVRGVGTPNNETELSNSARLTILRNGNVGIGTTSPAEKLSVAGNASLTGTIDSTGQSSKIRFQYNTFGDLPSAATYHGMFAHVHADAKTYYAHAGAWVPLANEAHTHAASDIASGLLTVNRGGTGADLAATGGAGQYLKQTSAGGAVSVGTIAAGDLPSLPYVATAGGTMTGPLNLPANGLVAGTNQLVLSGGNVGIGTTSVGSKLTVAGLVESTSGGVKFPDGTTQTTRAFQWQVVAGTSQQALANTGYVATDNASQVTITLPTAPNVGDTVRVSGAGAGGWKIAQNAGQSVIGTNLFVVGVSWTPRESNRIWTSVASAADGSKLVAVVYGGQIYTSTDSGVTWTARESNRDWYSVAAAADGSKLVAVVENGQIYTSTDSGVSWTPRESNRYWFSVASSADGSKLVAVVGGFGVGQIYTSTPSAGGNTTVGTTGSLSGAQSTAIELQYIGNGQFLPLSYVGVPVVK